MVRAVIMGWEHPRRSFLSRRRWIRRLLSASFRRMLVFTRNPSGRSVLEKADTSFNTGNPWGFRASPNSHPPKADDFACLRTSGGPALATQFLARLVIQTKRPRV